VSAALQNGGSLLVGLCLADGDYSFVWIFPCSKALCTLYKRFMGSSNVCEYWGS